MDYHWWAYETNGGVEHQNDYANSYQNPAVHQRPSSQTIPQIHNMQQNTNMMKSTHIQKDPKHNQTKDDIQLQIKSNKDRSNIGKKNVVIAVNPKFVNSNNNRMDLGKSKEIQIKNIKQEVTKPERIIKENVKNPLGSMSPSYVKRGKSYVKR